MRLDYDQDWQPTVRVSVRNLRTLIIKAGLPDSARVIHSGYCYHAGELLPLTHLLMLTVSEAPESWVHQEDRVVIVALTVKDAQSLADTPAEVEIHGVRVIAEPDDQHYRDRESPGRMHPDTELFLSATSAAAPSDSSSTDDQPPDDATRSPRPVADATSVAVRLLGAEGRMISQSKSRYRAQHPTHLIIFNANLCLNEGAPFWSGDLNVDIDTIGLLELSRRVGAPIYILHEFDGALANVERPLIDHAIAVVWPDGTIERRPRPFHAWTSDGRRLL